MAAVVRPWQCALRHVENFIDYIITNLYAHNGDDVWLIQAEADGRPLVFADHVQFGPTDLGVALSPAISRR